MATTLEDKAIWEDGEVLRKDFTNFLCFGFYKTIVVLIIRIYTFLHQEMDEEVLRMSTDEVVSRTRLLDNEIKVSALKCFKIVSKFFSYF